MKAFTIIAAFGFALIASGCQTQKSRHACQQDVERLKGSIDATAAYLEALRPELKAGFLALEACDVRFRACEPGLWLSRAEEMRLEHRAVKDRFTRAVNVYQPEGCISYIQSYDLNPPQPRTYNGYFSSLEQAGDQIDELVERFNKRVRT